MKIIYEGKDIYPEVGVNRCVYDSYCGDRSDTLTIVFNDSTELWDKWHPKPGAELMAEQDSLRTGKMYIYSFAPENGLFTLRARSVPKSAFINRAKSYEKVRFLDIASEIAGRNGLSLNTYGVNNNLYGYAEQRNISDMQLLNSRCMLEGYAMLVCDGKLVIYDEQTFEDMEPVETIEATKGDDFYYTENDGLFYGSCTLTNGTYTGTYSSGQDGKELKRRCNLYADCDGDMIRFARGVLRNQDKNRRTCILDGKRLYDGIAAGSVVNLKTAGAESWNGTAFVTHVRHDLIFMLSKIDMRKPLGW